MKSPFGFVDSKINSNEDTYIINDISKIVVKLDEYKDTLNQFLYNYGRRNKKAPEIKKENLLYLQCHDLYKLLSSLLFYKIQKIIQIQQIIQMIVWYNRRHFFN